MGINTSLENLIVVKLPQELEGHGSELQAAAEMVRHKGDCDVVVDFSHTTIVGSPTFSRLLELRRLLRESQRKLVLCGVAPAARTAFSGTLLDKLFDFAEDVPAALANVHGYA
jgi:anti-anti-sigma regulatory factor